MTKCAAHGCKNKGIHMFPKDSKRRKLWEKALRRKNWTASKWSKLCSDHFNSDDYYGESSYTGNQPLSKFLRSTAVPSKFSSQESKETPLAKQRQAQYEIRSKRKLFTSTETPSTSGLQSEIEIENDMENYVKFKLVGGKLILKKDACPHKFSCQQQTVKKNERAVVKKRRQKELIHKILHEDTPNPINSKSFEEIFAIDPAQETVSTETSDPLKFDEENQTEKHECETKIKKEPELQLSNKEQAQGEVFGCNECNENIQDGDGRMYKCLQCPNLLMCAACEDSDAHHKHSVVRFPSRRIYDKVKDLFALLQRQFKERLAIRSKSDADKDINSELEVDDDLNSDDNDKDEDKNIKQLTEEPSSHAKLSSGVSNFISSWTDNDDPGTSETFVEVPVTNTELVTHTNTLEPQHNSHIYIKHKPKKRQRTEEPVYKNTSELKGLATETFDEEIVIKKEPADDGMDLGQLADTVIKLEAPDYCEADTLDQSQCIIYGSHTSVVKKENT